MLPLDLVRTTVAKKVWLCLLFFGLSPLVLGLTIYLLIVFPSSTKVLGDSVSSLPSTGRFYAALPEDTGAVASMVHLESSTPIVVENYLRHYNSPLLPYKDKILEMAARYNVRPQLIVAIAQQESNLGKKSPEGCFNAWGWAIHERGTLCFANWEEAIETVTAGIGRNYCAKGLCDDPCEMMKKYTPKSNGSWCAGINHFLEEMETGNFVR